MKHLQTVTTDHLIFQQMLKRKQFNLKKIIESNEEIIYEQGRIIKNLSLELVQTKKNHTQISKRLGRMSQFFEASNLEQTVRQKNKKLIQTISNLELNLVETKIESATKHSQILNTKHELKKLKNYKKIEGSSKYNALYINTLSKTKIVDLIKSDSPTKLKLNNFYRNDKSPYSEQQIKQWVKQLKITSALEYLQNKRFREKTKIMIKKFIPHKLRKEVWPKLIENQLAITKSLYSDRKIKTSEKVKQQIQRDIQRSYPLTHEFNQNSTLLQNLQQLLELFDNYRPDISYVQGMTYPATVLLMILQKQKAFECFCNLIIANQFIINLYTFNLQKINLYCRTFQNILKENIPWLFEKLEQLNINSQIYLIQWFYTLFSRSFSFETALKIWDLLIYYGEVILFKIALAIFDNIKNELQIKDYQNCISTIKNFGDYTEQSKLLESIISNKLTEDQLYCMMNNQTHQEEGQQ